MKKKETDPEGNLILKKGQQKDLLSGGRIAETDASFRSIFENTLDAIYVLDEKCVFIDVNPSATRMYGYDWNEMVGYTPAKLSAPGKNDLIKTEELILRAFKGESQRFEWWGLRKNGEEFPKDVTLNRGLYYGRQVVFAMARDITERLQAIEAIKEREDKYRTLANQLPVGVYRTTIDGRIIYSNLALARILGYESPEELLNTPVSKLYANPSDRDDQLNATKSSYGVIQSVLRLKKKSGDLIWARDYSSQVPGKNDTATYFDGILEDITESKRIEGIIKESEANLKALIENTLENIWSVDRDFRIQYVNEIFTNAFSATFGKKLSRGVNIIDCLPEGLRSLWKERYERTFSNEHYVFEDKIEIPGGKAVYIEVAMNPIVVDGKVVGASMYGRDVTEKRLAELQLQYLSDLRNLLAELSTGFINLPFRELDTAINHSLARMGEFVGADRSYIIEYDFKNNTGTNTFEWCFKGVEPQISAMQKVPLDNFSEWIGLHKSGRIVKVDDSAELPHNSLRELLEIQSIKSMITIPLLTEQTCVGFVGFDSVRQTHLYTEYEEQLLQVYAQMIINVKVRIDKEQRLIRAKEKAEESDRLKTAFLANMSHEIRTPMNGILGFLEILRETNLSEENKAAYIEIVTQSGHRLLDTINDIIEISKIESGELKVHLSRINISELIAYFHGFFSQQAVKNGISFIVSNEMPQKYNIIKSDRIKLESIISNLIRNAIKFTRSGTVEFSCRPDSDVIRFTIRDTGTGIPAEKLDTIFERFVQADQTNSRTHEGSGLGLSIVRAYVEMLNGRIWVESEPGKGSTFTFTVPLVPATDDAPEVKRQYETHPKTEMETKILIAEDDFASFLYLEKLLKGKNVIIFHTTNGADTVKMVRDDPSITIILMDLRMPGMTGLEAVKLIRQFNKTVPVIAQTAYALAGDKEVAMKAGCNDYLTKPIKKEDLQRVIEKHTGRENI